LVVIAFAYPIYVSVAHERQGLVVRLAAASILGIALLQIHKRLRRDLDGQPPSRFELARQTRPPPFKIDPHLAKLRGEVQHSLKSRHYFDDVLWPRLVALGTRRGSILRPPPPRWPAARGPNLRQIADLVSTVERTP
jgi:hypothetical protein